MSIRIYNDVVFLKQIKNKDAYEKALIFASSDELAKTLQRKTRKVNLKEKQKISHISESAMNMGSGYNSFSGDSSESHHGSKQKTPYEENINDLIMKHNKLAGLIRNVNR